MDTLHIKGATRWSDSAVVNIAIAEGHIRTATTEALEGAASKSIDAAGWLASPAFVEAHYHLDKVLFSEGAKPGSTFEEVVALVAESKRAYTVENVAARAAEVARLMASRGVTCIRTFADVDSYAGFVALEALVAVRRELASIVDLQIVAFPQHGLFSDPGTVERIERAIDLGADVIGGHPQLEATAELGYRQIDLLFEWAQRHDRDLDFHVDETDAPD